jgi:hypothetical protein
VHRWFLPLRWVRIAAGSMRRSADLYPILARGIPPGGVCLGPRPAGAVRTISRHGPAPAGQKVSIVTTTTSPAQLAECVSAYARRLHAAAGPGHHVASPLGAWLLLALCGPASAGADRDTLAEVLGCDVDAAARAAAGLLSSPHPLVGSAAAAWFNQSALSEQQRAWQRSLPAAVRTGPVPTQAEADRWARDNSFGLIKQFPLQLDPSVYLLLATALATKVSWQVPFGLAPASALGADSPWAERLRRVLRTPERGHTQFIAATETAGDVAVHIADARDGLLVASVAAAAEVPPGVVLAAAHAIACGQALGSPARRRPLAELPLGDGPLWSVCEEDSAQAGHDLVTAVLPAWSAESRLALADPSLGFDAAAHALAPGDQWAAAQAAMARYTRTGFEAAAVSALAVALSMRAPRRGPRRVAELRFAHPYAVVAVTLAGRGDRTAGAGQQSPWQGLPVFSAWVANPEDAQEEEDRN